MFSNWATPVVRRRWAVWAAITETICRASGYRILVHAKARAWERAVGV